METLIVTKLRNIHSLIENEIKINSTPAPDQLRTWLKSIEEIIDLIAAPDLLEALRMVVDVFNLHTYGADTGGGKCYAKIQAAIAKAEGGEK